MRIVNFLIEDLLPGIFAVVSAENIRDDTEGPFLKRMVQYCFLLLSALAKENIPNSEALFGRLDFMTKFNDGYNFRVANLISEIFQDNDVLMRRCEDELVADTWQLAIKTRAARFLDFMCVLLANDGAPLKFNQDRLSEVVKAGCPSDLFSIDFNMDSDELILFHNSLITMAALLCAGRHRYSIDFFLTDVGLSYPQVLGCINDESIGYESRIAYTLLMKTLFINREPYEVRGTPQHRLTSNRMALITSDSGAMCSPNIEWP